MDRGEELLFYIQRSESASLMRWVFHRDRKEEKSEDERRSWGRGPSWEEQQVQGWWWGWDQCVPGMGWERAMGAASVRAGQIVQGLAALVRIWAFTWSEMESHRKVLNKGWTRADVFLRLILRSRPGWRVVTGQAVNTISWGGAYGVADVLQGGCERWEGLFPLTTLNYKFNFLI